MARVEKGHHAKESFKMPWIILGQEFYQTELSRLLLDNDFQLDAEDYDFNKGGLKYFHGAISRQEAGLRLQERQTDGVFLVRTGSTGENVISIISQGTEKHIEILKGEHGGVKLGTGPEMPSITQMMIANFGREISGVGIKFSVPVPPGSRMLADKVAAKAAAAAQPVSTSAAQPTNPFAATNPFGATPQVNVQEAVKPEDLTVGELRLLLQQNKIDYRTANNRSELEMLATGLTWSTLKRTSSLNSHSKVNPEHEEKFVEHAGPAQRSKSVSAKSQSLSALKPATVPIVEKTTSALNLFAKYKRTAANKVTSPGGKSPSRRPSLSPVPNTNSASTSPSTSYQSPTPSQQRTPPPDPIEVSPSQSPSQPTREEKARLSMMANDFFGSLLAEKNAAATGPSAAAQQGQPISPTASLVASASQSQKPSSATTAVPTRVDDESDDDLSDDDLSDDDSSDDDEDDDDDDNRTSGVASRKESNESKASAQFWDKMKEATNESQPSSPAPEAASAADAAELRKAKRREKLAAMAKQAF